MFSRPGHIPLGSFFWALEIFLVRWGYGWGLRFEDAVAVFGEEGVEAVVVVVRSVAFHLHAALDVRVGIFGWGW